MLSVKDLLHDVAEKDKRKRERGHQELPNTRIWELQHGYAFPLDSLKDFETYFGKDLWLDVCSRFIEDASDIDKNLQPEMMGDGKLVYQYHTNPFATAPTQLMRFDDFINQSKLNLVDNILQIDPSFQKHQVNEVSLF